MNNLIKKARLSDKTSQNSCTRLGSNHTIIHSNDRFRNTNSEIAQPHRLLRDTIDLDTFAEKLFITKTGYNDLEWELLQICNYLALYVAKLQNRFLLEDVYQHGWYILATKDISTIGSFRSQMYKYLRYHELGEIRGITITSYFDEPMTPKEPLDVAIKHIVDDIKLLHSKAGEVLEMHLRGYTQKEIMSLLNYSHRTQVVRLLHKGLDYAQTLCS